MLHNTIYPLCFIHFLFFKYSYEWKDCILLYCCCNPRKAALERMSEASQARQSKSVEKARLSNVAKSSDNTIGP